MERKTMDTLRTMICGELDDIAKKGSLTHEQLDVLKDLLESAKNIEKIEKYQKEKESEWEMDRGYSQRKYYIDADYNPYSPHSFGGRGMYDDHSYGRSRVMYGMDDGHSYRYYDPRYDMPMYPAAYASGTHEMVGELTQMMNETHDEKAKSAIQKAITEMNK